MKELELAAGTIEYEDTGGSDPVVVLLHGVVMNGTLWRHVVADLRSDHRCVVPRCRWVPIAGRCERTPISRSPARPAWWRSS
jgi:pimeloyl-ACP methyl ester carboxylesterase